MFEEPVVFVDIETTGASYKTGRIIEIAIIRYHQGRIADTYQTLINPGLPLSPHITALTGIRPNDLDDQPYFDEIAEEIYRKLQGAVFIAHHVRFDYSFIKRQLEACGYKFTPKLICSVRLSRALYPEARGHSLQKIIERHNLSVAGRHRALADATAVHDFMLLAYQEHGAEQFGAAIKRQLKSRSLPPNLSEEYLADVTDTPGVYIFENEQGTPIYIGKSITLRKRIMSHFTGSTKLDKEMKLSMHTHRLRTISTDTELEALLLESQLVKKHLPLYNHQLRRVQNQLVLHKSYTSSGYAKLSASVEDLSEANSLSDIYGVFKTKGKMKSSLELAQKTFDLCPKLLGLENGSGACFKYQLKRCKGACSGYESADSYNHRFETAMQRVKLEAWPFTRPIVVQLSDTKGLVLDNWAVAGYYHEEFDSEPYVEPTRRSFDLDTYRILRAYLAKSPNFMPLPDTLSMA